MMIRPRNIWDKSRFWGVLIAVFLLLILGGSVLASDGGLVLPDGVVRWEDDCLICYYDEINGTQCYQCPEAECTQIEDNPTLTPTPKDTLVPTETPVSTETPHPIDTPVSTNTPLPTETLVPNEKPKCNQGRGNSEEGCDPGNSNHNHSTNDESGQRPGDHGGRD